ncbi:hypothetical protein ABFA07_005120 [Porites harrisoni]
MIKDVTSQDRGVYTCKARNILGMMTSSATLTVQVRALITHKSSSITVEEGQNVSLQCKATGLPAPRVTWRKAFSKLPVKRSSIVNGNLSIHSITKADSGTYACSAKNVLGDDSAVAVVMVIDRL